MQHATAIPQRDVRSGVPVPVTIMYIYVTAVAVGQRQRLYSGVRMLTWFYIRYQVYKRIWLEKRGRNRTFR